MWMNASETAFLKAEAALRGWNMGGTAEDFYNQGVELSFAQWGASGADDYLADSSSVAKSYVDPMGINSYNGITSTVKIKWSSTADFEENLERIITQKWIANFPLGRESWSEFRRTGYPKLMPVVTNNSGGVVDNNLMVRRLTYPSEEYSENGDNVNDALVSLGGADLMSTRVWWDCNPNVN